MLSMEDFKKKFNPVVRDVGPKRRVSDAFDRYSSEVMQPRSSSLYKTVVYEPETSRLNYRSNMVYSAPGFHTPTRRAPPTSSRVFTRTARPAATLHASGLEEVTI